MWLMMQQETPDDYVIATGETYSIKEFLDALLLIILESQIGNLM